MKYLKLFENLYYEYEDDRWRIQKIKSGPNKGKINIQKRYFKEGQPQLTGEWTKFSPLAGCVRFLDTKYENDPRIRQIQYDYSSKEVNISTMDAVFRNFLSKLGYKSKEDLFGAESIIRGLRVEFGKYLQEISNNAKTLGELMDGLREVEELVEPYTMTKKYNL